MTSVLIHDSLMGTGKSTRMIEMINNSPEEQRWIVVTPFLKECHRYAGTLIDPASGEDQKPLRDERGKTIYTGEGCSASGRRFQHPTAGYRSKVEDIEFLIEMGQDIVTTHSALKLFTPETVKNIKDLGYRLVIDEELECIRPQNIKPHRRKMLLDSGAIYKDGKGLLRWNSDFPVSDVDEVDKATGYSWDMQIKRLCDTGSLLLIEDTRSFFVWEYPVDFLLAFDHIDVLTYMFEGSVFQKYLSYYQIPYTIVKGVSVPVNPFSLINIIEGRINKVGERDFVFSATDQRKYTRQSAVSQTVRANLENFFKNTTYGKSSLQQRMWTCLKEAESSFKGKGYSSCWVAANTKAVNDYEDTTHLAYVYNSYLHPDIIKILSLRDTEANSDRFALTEMLQWIYRSRIRQNKQIILYIPSKRMRELLTQWMEGNFL